MNEIIDHDYLEHHGILGQKWYDRNGPPYPLNPAKDYSAKEKKLNKISEAIDKKKKEIQNARAIREKEAEDRAKDLAIKMNYKLMSDQELRNYITRADLEKQYKEKVLPKQKENKFKKFVKDEVKSVNENVVSPLIENYLKSLVVDYLEDNEKVSESSLNTIRKKLGMDEKHISSTVVKDVLSGKKKLEDLNDSEAKTYKELKDFFEVVEKNKNKKEIEDIINKYMKGRLDTSNLKKEQMDALLAYEKSRKALNDMLLSKSKVNDIPLSKSKVNEKTKKKTEKAAKEASEEDNEAYWYYMSFMD